VTRRSYYGPDPDWWPVIAEALPRPWSREAIMHDLCWWADQERIGRRARPGRPALCARWGVTGHAARTLMRDEDAWGDPAHRRQPTASESTADRQPTASRPPVAARANASNAAETASESPADRQPVASRPPADRPTRGVDTDTHTDTATGTEHTHAPTVEPDLADVAADLMGIPVTSLSSRDVHAILAAGATCDDLRAIDRWRRESKEYQAELARRDRWPWGTLLDRKRAPERIAAGRRWVRDHPPPREQEPIVLAPPPTFDPDDEETRRIGAEFDAILASIAEARA